MRRDSYATWSSPSTLYNGLVAFFIERGVISSHASYMADALTRTSLKGIDTHGIELLHVYMTELSGGRSQPNPTITISKPASVASIVDADNALGIVAATIGVREAIKNAKSGGIGIAVVKNSNHFGAAGHYAELAASQNMICLVFSNSDALVAAHDGVKPINGTNPIAMAAPGVGDEVFSLDMATSQVSYSQALRFLTEDRVPEPGWAVDRDGNDFAKAKSFVALKPLGGYKGQGLGLMVQVFTCLLAGMPFDHQITNLFVEPFDHGRQISHTFICLDIESFISPNNFRSRLTELLEHQRSVSQDGATMVAGDKERRCRISREQRGIPLSAGTHDLLRRYLAI